MRHDGHVLEGAGGEIRIPGDALAALVVTAVELVPGARVRRPRRGLDVTVKEGRAHVAVEVVATYGTVLPELAASVQRSVTDAVRASTGLELDGVDVVDPGARPVTAAAGRRQARRTALFLLYQWDLTGQPLTTLYEGTPDAFALELAESVAGHADELDVRITEAAEGWTADRLGTLERNVLRIGIHELESESVPAEVAINEAVVLAKRYASEDAARLVNGILARVARERTEVVE